VYILEVFDIFFDTSIHSKWLVPSKLLVNLPVARLLANSLQRRLLVSPRPWQVV